MLEQTFAIPRGNEAERVRVGALDTHALHVRIEVRDVDELRAALIGRRGGRTRLLLEADLGPDQHDLAFLHVRPVDGQLGEAGESAGHRKRTYAGPIGTTIRLPYRAISVSAFRPMRRTPEDSCRSVRFDTQHVDHGFIMLIDLWPG